MRCLQTMNVSLTLMVPNFTSNVTWPIGLILLTVTDEHCMPVQCYNLLVFCCFTKQALLIANLDVTVSQSVKILFLFIIM